VRRLLFVGDGGSMLPDYAAAIVDAIESGRFVGERFTAAY
jgi:putative NADH-flavin reductase